MAFKEIEVPESPKLYTRRYEGLGGVDFSCDSSEVDLNRTPTGVNMISDEGSFPVKRKGWRILASLPEGAGKVKKMVTKELTDEDRVTLGSDAEYNIFAVCEGGTYRITHRTSTDDTVTKLTSRASRDELHFYFGGDLYFFGKYTGGDYTFQKYQNTGDGLPARWAVEPYVPEVTITLSADGTGGFSLEPVNSLTAKRKFSFIGDDTSLRYYLYPETVRSDPKFQKIHWAPGLKVEVYDIENGWQTLSQNTDFTVSERSTVTGLNVNGAEFTAYVIDPYIEFTTTHPATTQEDNIRITFTPFDMTEAYSGVYKGVYKEERIDIMTGTCSAIYGHTTTDRVFIAGGINKNRVYYSQVNDPTYFPDTYYVNVGYDTNEIVGMVRVSDSLAVIKSDSVYDNTLYMIRGSFLTDDIGYGFTVLPTSAKLGAIAPNSIKTLVDEPLFLTRNGVYGIANTYATTEKTIRGRSRYVDKKLLKEPHLEDASAVVWNRYYILCVNDHCYILDGRHKQYDKTGNTDYQYECYYWENFPATAFTTFEDDLIFGTADGRICKYNSDIEHRSAYCDNGVATTYTDPDTEIVTVRIDMQDDNAIPITCEWSTPLDGDKLPQYLKTLNKKGNVVSIVPAERCQVNIDLIKDGILYRTITDTSYAGTFSWSELSFVEFPFGSSEVVRDKFPRKKVKKYKRLQIILRNAELFQPFGIIGITKTYTVGNFAKK